MLWTTKYVDAAVAQLPIQGHEIREEDIARLSPLKHRNLNLLGCHSFTASTPAASALRPAPAARPGHTGVGSGHTGAG
ncbi:Tn3 family transposase [Streptomyces sp. M19]